MAPRTLELLESVMAGHTISPDELDALLLDRVPEDLHLEYKHGAELQDRKKAAATVRQYLSGFANSAGGLLFIGVDEQTWSVTKTTAPGDSDLPRWAATCIADLLPFSPPPRFHVINHPNGNVLVAATARSEGFISTKEGKQQVYYLRIQDQMYRAPEYLVTDLLLGRRERPHLYVSDFNFSTLERYRNRNNSINSTNIDLGLSYTIENQSISWGSDTIAGCIAFCIDYGGYGTITPIGNQIKSYTNIDDTYTKNTSNDIQLIHLIRRVEQIWPFSTISLNDFGIYSLPLTKDGNWLNYTWKAAFYHLTKNTPPQWYQIQVPLNIDFLSFINNDTERLEYRSFLTIEPLFNERPTICWEPMQTPGH